VDFQARLDRRETLQCEDCGRRIAWTTGRRIALEGQAAWRWQGEGVPIRYRIVGEGREAGVVVDLECFSCGWSVSRSVLEVPLAALTLLWREELAFRERWAEQTEQCRAEAS
jgi:hypothetical protein